MARDRRIKRAKRTDASNSLLSQTAQVRHYGGPQTPQTVPAALAGRYVAWSPDGLRILGSGLTIDEARANAGGSGRMIFQKIPHATQIRSSAIVSIGVEKPVAT